MGHNGIGDGFFNVIVEPHGDCLFSVFVGLQRTDAILINMKNSK